MVWPTLSCSQLQGYLHCLQFSITSPQPVTGDTESREVQRDTTKSAAYFVSALKSVRSEHFLLYTHGSEYFFYNGWSHLHYLPAFCSLFSCCWCSSYRQVEKWAGCNTRLQMSLGTPRCSFSAISLALLSRDHTHSNLPRAKARKQGISSLDESLTTPP